VLLSALALTSVALVQAELKRAPRAGTGSDTLAAIPVRPPAVLVPLETPAVDGPSAVAQVVVDRGTGTFAQSATSGATVGSSGLLLRYHVAVEHGIGISPEDFAASVEAILGDPRSWTAAGEVRFQRVPGGTAANFTIYLATPVTSEAMCREEWLETERYTSCRLSSGKVVINLARWLTAVPNYGAPLDVYRAYAINHEVGHQLGNGHELCPRQGQPAPVMQQQTLGLQGCVANAWPYVNGGRYRGPAANR
jgi:hypothetical protein